MCSFVDLRMILTVGFTRFVFSSPYFSPDFSVYKVEYCHCCLGRHDEVYLQNCTDRFVWSCYYKASPNIFCPILIKLNSAVMTDSSFQNHFFE